MTVHARRWRLAWLVCFGVAAAAAVPDNSVWSVRVWQSDDGLPNNIITGLAQTPDGYLWVANATRLARFDGVQFEEFPTRALTGGLSHKITTLQCGKDGSLWLATDRGAVARLKSGSVQVITNHLPALFVESLVEDSQGTLWVKNRGGALIYRIDGAQVTQLPLEGSYRSVAADGRGRLWFVKSGELGLFRGGKFETLVQLGQSGAARLTSAKEEGVWICLGSELFRFKEGDEPRSCGAFKPQSAVTEPNVMLEDRTGAVWIGTSDSGLFRYDGAGFESIPVSHRQILSLLEDREGNIWVGTGGGGLDRVQPQAVALEGMQSSLPFETVQSLCEDSHGVVWATTQNGLLVCRTNGSWRTISSEPGWPGGRAACVAADAAGAVWIGTRNHRLHCLRNGQFTSWQSAEGLDIRNFHALLATSAGDLWMAGTGSGCLQYLHAGQLKHIPLPPRLQSVHSLVEDASGDLWVGAMEGALLRVHNDVVTDETPRTSGPAMSIRVLQTTPDGCLWLGYGGGGLGLIKGGRYARITVSRGLFDDHISQIVADGGGWLWLGGDHGIFKARQRELEAFLDNPNARVNSIHYGPGEGLVGMQANYGESPGVLRGHDGRLWMPMRTALVVIDPKSLRENPEPPTVLLKRVVADDRVQAQYGGVVPAGTVAGTENSQTELRLRPDHRHLEFTYTALSFNAPKNIRFQYRLEGFDNDWVDAGGQRAASYSRLAAGHYRFRVRACNSQGGWNETGGGLALVVLPFFWQTWWFWLLALLGFTSLVALVVRSVSHHYLRARLQTLERQAALDRERTRIARDIHDDIGNLLTQTTLLSGLALRDRDDPQKTGEHARQISRTVEQVTNSLDEIVWAINPRNDTLPQLIDYLGQFAMEFLQPAGIRCRVDLPDNPPQRVVATDLRHNLFLAVKEALNNVVRHSGAGEVLVRVVVTEASLDVTIQDDGRGFEAGALNGSGNGLRNMRQRMDELGGQFELENQPAAGTRIILRLPWRQRK